MAKLKYSKPPLDSSEQLDLLGGRGLFISDELRAIRYLENIGYYRLSPYLIPFEEKSDGGSRKHQLKNGISFDKILNIYLFDRKLRHLLLEIIERIEISFRAWWVNVMSEKTKDSHFYLKSNNFMNILSSSLSDKRICYNSLLNNIEDKVNDVERKIKEEKAVKEISIKSYLEKYSSPRFPPTWVVAEYLTFGEFSMWYSITQSKSYKKKIANKLGIPSGDLMQTVLKCLTDIRNMCSHHERLYGTRMVAYPPLLDKYKQAMNIVIQKEETKEYEKADNSVYNYIVIAVLMLMKINPKSTWIDRLINITKIKNENGELIHNKDIDLKYLGFPSDWESRLKKTIKLAIM
ncbi:Abi family protein [Francisella sp. LA112445]|uniref:Abi family protein n=1 Tax=Francisella sp. LA112445 TaxID=1395624 RepID=UPI001788E486|nr:Abi family protein [Francisella sp. LA112445]QIW11028.1 Abi family protein [Francisella sp. LA112445]